MEDVRNAQEVQTNAADRSIVDSIESKILNIRGRQVMLDRDLAVLYGVSTSNLNKAVSRNLNRFPEDFMFVLTTEEWKSVENLLFQNGISKHGGSRFAPHVFTKHGVVVLANILKSDIAINMSIRITRAFVSMRHNMLSYSGHEQRIVSIERHLIETDQKIDHVLNCLEEGTLKEKAHIFSAGQIYEASIRTWNVEQHDRWLIIDDDLWHCGASLKDVGVRTFGIDPIGMDVNIIMMHISYK